MILKGINNQTVDLKVIKPIGDNDSDWVRIYLDVKSDLGNWKTTDESLMVSELKELVQWFKDLSLNNKIEYTELYFTEPNLEFDLIENKNEVKRIKLIFSAESEPKSAIGEQEYFIEFEFTNVELEKIAKELEKELKNG